jgi:cytochrome c-type biogenesis protein
VSCASRIADLMSLTLPALITEPKPECLGHRTVILLLSYSIGLAVPIVLLGLGSRWVLGASRFLSRHYDWVARVGGAVMMTIGLLLVSGLWLRLLGPVFRLVNRFTPAI